jgi:hypothetical protein
MARFFLFFLFLGQNGLHHIAWLGDVREVDLRDDCLRAVTGCRSAGMSRRLSVLRKSRANFLRLVQFH